MRGEKVLEGVIGTSWIDIQMSRRVRIFSPGTRYQGG